MAGGPHARRCAHEDRESALDGVGPGSVLGGRYVLRRRLDDDPGTARWAAHDETLDRTVEVRVVSADHPAVDAVLDAARRAAGIEDQRLLRVLDVGRDGRTTYVVSEWVDAQSLTDRLRRGPVTAEEARTITGETSLALEKARHRGLHHLRLAPDHVLRLDDGSVKVAGLAVDAALAGPEVEDADEASRQDTVRLVALAYAALTGCWPLDDDTGLPPAPRVSGAPAAPAQIVSGVPADLDTLCVQAFAGAGAPDTPGDLAGQIAPWGEKNHPQRPVGTFPLTLPPTRRPDPPADTAAGPAPQPRSGPTLPTAPLPAVPPRPSADPVPATATDPVPGPATDPAPATDPVPAPATGPGPAAEHGREPEPTWTSTLFTDDLREPPAPLLPPVPTTRPPRDQTRTVIALVVGFVIVMALLAKCGLSGLGDNAFVSRPRTTHPTAAPSPSVSATTPSPGASESPTPSPPAPTPVGIAAAAGFDPEGDGSEKDSIAPRAFDGDTGTSWTSDTYNSDTFGGLKKGVGLRLDLGKETEVHSVQVTVGGTGSALELRTGSGDALSGYDVVATAKDASGATELKPTGTVTTRYLLVWFTKPAPAKGGFRVEVAEVAVS